jgi:hypothetical protein
MFVPLLPKRSGGQKATGSMRTGLCWTWPLPELASLVSSPQTLICCSRSLSPTMEVIGFSIFDTSRLSSFSPSSISTGALV